MLLRDLQSVQRRGVARVPVAIVPSAPAFAHSCSYVDPHSLVAAGFQLSIQGNEGRVCRLRCIAVLVHHHCVHAEGFELPPSVCKVLTAGEWLDGMTAKVPRNDAPEEIEVRIKTCAWAGQRRRPGFSEAHWPCWVSARVHCSACAAAFVLGRHSMGP